MSLRIGVVTLASDDVDAAEAFYRRFLDTRPVRDRHGVVYFRLDGATLALHAREALAEYCGVDAHGDGFDRITLSVNVDDARAVDDIAARASAAGATLVRGPETAAWGGYVAWIADPDRHLWELVFNPKRAGAGRR